MAAVIAIVRDLVRFLSQDPLSVEDVIDRVGPVVRDPGVPMPMELNPAMPDVSSAKLTRYPDSGLPYLLTIEPSLDARPSATSLEAAFGGYKRSRTDPGIPAELIFYPPANAPHWRVAVIARLESSGSDLDSAPVTSISFRRDPLS